MVDYQSILNYQCIDIHLHPQQGIHSIPHTILEHGLYLVPQGLIITCCQLLQLWVASRRSLFTWLPYQFCRCFDIFSPPITCPSTSCPTLTISTSKVRVVGLHVLDKGPFWCVTLEEINSDFVWLQVLAKLLKHFHGKRFRKNCVFHLLWLV